MMDLITDFHKIIEESTNNTILELKKFFNIDVVNDNQQFIKKVNTYYIALQIWNKKLKDDKNNIFLDNILLNYCSILNCIVLKDEKVIYFLYRNTIESMIRVLSCEFSSRDIEEIFKKISHPTISANQKRILQDHISLLKSIYKECCQYVHTNPDYIPKITILPSYYSSRKKEKMLELMKIFSNLNTSILCILKIKHDDIYSDLKPNARSFLNEITPLKHRTKTHSVK